MRHPLNMLQGTSGHASKHGHVGMVDVHSPSYQTPSNLSTTVLVCVLLTNSSWSQGHRLKGHEPNAAESKIKHGCMEECEHVQPRCICINQRHTQDNMRKWINFNITGGKVLRQTFSRCITVPKIWHLDCWCWTRSQSSVGPAPLTFRAQTSGHRAIHRHMPAHVGRTLSKRILWGKAVGQQVAKN